MLRNLLLEARLGEIELREAISGEKREKGMLDLRSTSFGHLGSLCNSFVVWHELLFGILDAFDQEVLILLVQRRWLSFGRHFIGEGSCMRSE